MRKSMTVLATMAMATVMVFSTGSGTRATAQGNELGQIIFENTLYGMGIGTLIGGALLLTTEKPGEHLDYISYGLLAGGLVGVGIGAYEVNVLYVDNGMSGVYVSTQPQPKLGLQMPSLSLSSSFESAAVSLNFLDYNF